MTYPPEPWSLRGRMHVTVWLLPLADLPALPDAVRSAATVVRLGARAVVGTAWVDYRPGGVLTYRELLAAVLVRDRWRPRVTITHIWVDSPESRDGGRALWGIPKDLAALTITADAAAAAFQASNPAVADGATGADGARPVSGADGASGAGGASPASGADGAHPVGPVSGVDGASGASGASGAGGPSGIATGRLGRARFGVRLPLGFTVLQALNGTAKASPVRSTARCGPARVEWTFTADGPLAYLARARPLLSLVADDFRMRFGTRSVRTRPGPRSGQRQEVG